MSGTNIRVIDLPDLGTVTDTSSFVIDKSTTTGRFSALAVKNYCAVATLPEAPSNNTAYGRMNGAWTPVLGDAPANSLPYARMNNAWSPVPPEAPLTGSVYGRGSAGWTPVLPITGGSISGNIATTGNILSGGAVYGQSFQLSSAVGYEWQFYIQAGTGHHIQQHRAGWYEAWQSTDGTRTWGSPTGTLMALNGVGDLSTHGNVNTINVVASAGYFLSGAYVGASGDSSFGFYISSGARVFNFSPNWYWQWSGTDGLLQWIANGAAFWVMRRSDNFCFNSLGPVGGVGAYISSSDRRTKTGVTPTSKGLAEVLQLVPMSFTRADPSTGAQEEIGFIAQDVQPIVPEAVWTAGIPLRDGSGGLDSGDPTLGLTSETITAVLVNAVKELNTLMGGLTARIQTLEGRSI